MHDVTMQIPAAEEIDVPGTGYRAHLQLPDGVDAVALAERHVRQWLRQKMPVAGVVDSWDGSASHTFDQQFSIAVVNRNDEQSDIHRRLYRLVDSNPGGKFWISLFAVASKNGTHGSVVIEGAVTGKSAEDAIDAVATPRIVREILDDVEARDGRTRLTGTPMFVRAYDIEVVLSAILDPQRQVSVIVASSLSREVDEVWGEMVARLTSNSVGIAAAFVVAGEAVDALNAALPESHQVPRGTVRTFASSVDISDPADGRAHRFLGPSTLARSVRGARITNRRLIEVHARGPRSRLLGRQLPAEVRRSIDLLEREERRGQLADEAARRTINEIPSVAESQHSERTEENTEASRVGTFPVGSALAARLRGLFKRWLGRDLEGAPAVAELETFIETTVRNSDVAKAYTEYVEGENKRLEDAVEAFKEQLDERDFDIASTADDLRTAERENRYLRQRLREHHDYDPWVGAAEPDAWKVPDDVEELIERLTAGEGTHAAFEYVEFTGRTQPVSEVRKRDPYGKYAQDLWEYVRVLFEYAKLRTDGQYEGNVHMYLCDDSLDSFRCPPQRHAAHESESVLSNGSWRQERMLPVPKAVHASCEVLMDAHFKPTHRDQFAPRMHYFDDLAGTGKIYIGYIGRHLTNTKS